MIALSVPVFAHASLIDSSPVGGETLSVSPQTLTLIFSELVEEEFSTFELHMRSGREPVVLNPLYRIDSDEQIVSFQLSGPLTADVYTLAWKVLSSVDGHTSSGAIPFGIGVAGVIIDESSSSTMEPNLTRLVVRWIDFLFLMILVGGVFFPLLARESLESKSIIHLRKFLLVAVGGLLLGSIVDLFIQSLLLESSMVSVIVSTDWAAIRLARFIFLFATGIALLSGNLDQFNLSLTRVLAILILFANALSGHSGALGFVGILPDVIHQFAAALWVGGLAQLAFLWIPGANIEIPGDKSKLIKTLILRFSNLALISIPLITLAGVFLALQHLGSFNQLFTSIYGQSVLAKAVLLIPIFVLAAINRRVILPKLSEAAVGDSTLPRLRKLILTEVSIVVMILFFAAVLTLNSPPLAGEESIPVQVTRGSQQFIHPGEENTLILDVSSTESGQDRFDIGVETSEGLPREGILKVWMTFQFQDEELGVVQADAMLHGETHYVIEGTYLNLPGEWLLTLFVRIRGQAEDLHAEFPLHVK